MRHIRGRISAHPEIPPGDTALVVSWVDLVDVTPGDRVLLVDPGHRRALAPLLARTAHVVAVSPSDLDDAHPGIPTPHDPGAGHDLVCLDGVRPADARLARLVEQLSPRGRVVQVVDNRLSPLRLADAARGRPRGPAPRAHLSLPLRSLRRTGLEVSQVFGLLRSSASPVTAFDLLSAEGVETTIRATLSHVGGARGVLLRRVARLPPSTVAWLSPAWLVVAERPLSGATTAVVDHHPGRIIGKISNRDSDEFKVVRGDPAHTLEKHYAISTPRAEVEALTELEEVGFTLAPRVVGLPEERVCRFSWMTGEPLVLERLDDEALVRWTARAARLLARLQQLTRRPDGTVLVHGDYWLGNLLVADDRITGVVDWTRARRGSPEVDRRFLLASVLDHRPDDEPLRRRLERIRDESLPGSSQPDPAACWLGDDAWPVTSGGAVPLADFADDVDVDKLLAWAEDQPTLPVLLPASWPALLLVCRHRDRLRPLARFGLPDPEVVEHLAAQRSVPAGRDVPRGQLSRLRRPRGRGRRRLRHRARRRRGTRPDEPRPTGHRPRGRAVPGSCRGRPSRAHGRRDDPLRAERRRRAGGPGRRAVPRPRAPGRRRPGGRRRRSLLRRPGRSPASAGRPPARPRADASGAPTPPLTRPRGPGPTALAPSWWRLR